MQDEIQREQEMEQKQLSFFAAVSHELLVTILKGQIQGMISGIGGYKDRDKYLKDHASSLSMEGFDSGDT